MTRTEFITKVNRAGEVLHDQKGYEETCALMDFTRGHYKDFLTSMFGRTIYSRSINQIKFKKFFNQLTPAQKRQTYQLRVLLIAVFTAEALKSKAYLRW